MTAANSAAAFHLALRRDPHDDTARLVYADWLDEHDEPKAAARLRWWVIARQKMRAGVTWVRSAERPEPIDNFIVLNLGWVQRLFTVEFARIVREKYPLYVGWERLKAISDDTFAVAELYALLLATDEELDVAQIAARTAARAAAESEAQTITRSAAETAAQVISWFAPWSVIQIAAHCSVQGVTESTIRSDTWIAAVYAAEGAAKSAAQALLNVAPLEE